MDALLSALPLRRGRLALAAIPASPAARAALLEFAPDLVLSLTPDDERARLGAADLPEWLSTRGIAWRAFPVADFSTPESPGWPPLAAEIATILDAGGRVLVHCRAGLGRSGMIALRLMAEAGEPPVEALARLRAARPGTVETEAQYRWAAAP
ncbi:MAG: dual specificity protein phosphatase family protein [Rhodobacteraceae bacterium]|nr:dual specificity protein phosphatase family protein [Paracoccaceae bacterium]